MSVCMIAPNRPIRLALFGGGPGAFIGAVHRRAALLDLRFQLVAGAFSRDASRSAAQARAFMVDEARAYTSVEALIAGEVGREDGVEAVAIATPNDSHFAIAEAALKAGLHVISDKPMTSTLAQATALEQIVAQTDCAYALTYTYTGYPMIREARASVASGMLGRVRKIVVTYPQGWLSDSVEHTLPGAAWRTDPSRAGIGGCIGDIGVHAFQLAEYISGLCVERLCADLSSVVQDRMLDDDCNILLRFAGDVPGVLMASQISLGERNGLSIAIYGEQRALSWSHERPGELRFLHPDNRMETVFAGSAAIGPDGMAASRLPAGHPEGFIEAFASIYSDFADAIQGQRGLLDGRLPGIETGLRSMRFVAAAVASSQNRSWIEMENSQQ
jgi:predicted dehydrogenase